MPRKPPSPRGRETIATLAFVALILVSVIAFPFGRIHAGACAIARTVAGRPDMPCGMSALAISIDTDRTPFIAVSLHLL